MTAGPTLHTNRLLLRRWQEDDLAPFAELNSDPVAMEYFPRLMSEAQTESMIEGMEAHFEEHGYGLWALELNLTRAFIGFTGLSVPGFEAAFTPAVEVDWRLFPKYWGSGYATEASREGMRFGFEVAGLEQIVSFTVPANRRSCRVMERIGMTHDPEDDFDHPSLENGSPLKRHVLYKMTVDRWRASNRH